MDSISLIARGGNLWKARKGPMRVFREFYEKTILPLASNTQFVELGVKDANLCGRTGLGELMRTAKAIVRSDRIFQCRMQGVGGALYFKSW